MRPLTARAWFTFAAASIAFAAGLAISAAAVFGTSEPLQQSARQADARLAAFGSCDGLRGYLRRHRDAITGGPIAELPVAAEDSIAASPGAAGEAAAPPPGGATNVQELGVDEPDIVKASGSTIFALAGNRLRAVDVSSGTPALLGSVELPDGPGSDAYGPDSELLIAGGRALVITRSYGVAVDYATDVYYGGGSQTTLTEFDISDPAAIERMATMKVDGDYASARLTGSTARVVVGAHPALPIADAGHGRAWMPKAVLRDGAARAKRGSLVDCRDVRRPRRFSGAEMLSVLTIDLERGLPALDTDAVMTGGEIVYASPSSLYVATERWQGADAGAGAVSDVSTAIHRFDTSDPQSTEYAGSGAVDGYMLSQWSMSEYEGVLRVASTTSPPWDENGPQGESESLVTTFAPDGDGLAKVGRLAGLGQGEQIYAVRFIDDLAYVVTFRQVDPLHVVDLSDPTDPRLAGELEIPGYSAYLHPVGPGLLLGIGQDASAGGALRGAQASLFDVSDAAAPVRIDHVSLGRNSSTEVEYDHHAFTWDPARGLAVLPLESYDDGFAGAVGLKLDGATLEPTARTSQGRSYEAAIRRSVVIGGLVYTVSNRGIAAHDPQTLARLALTPFAGPA